jgi:low temperature requirement protein LtrA
MTRTPSIVSPDDQKVTWVELFFDLVFVFCVTQVVSMFHGHIDLATAGSALLVFWLVWWAWTQFTWALNAANTEHTAIQLSMMAATAVAFFLAIGIPGAFGARAAGFAAPYIAVRSIGLGLYYAVARHDLAQLTAVRVFGGLSIGGLVAVAIGAAAGGIAQYIWWGLAIVLDLIAAGVGGQREGWNVHPEHFVERHGLVVIIALGETLIVAAAGLVNAPMTAPALATGVLAVAVTCGLWWSYFRRARPLFEHAMAHRHGSARSSLARDAFSVIHFPMLCGVIAIAAGSEAALAAPGEPLTAGARLALGVGTALFVCGTALAVVRATGRLMGWRCVLALAGATAAFIAGGAPWVTLSILVATLIAVSLVEQRHM